MNIFVVLHRYTFKKLDTKLNLLLTGMITVIASSLIMSFLNALILSPVYWYLLANAGGWLNGSSLIDNAKASYENVYPVAFLGIPNYWVGIMTAFALGNLAKYSVVTVAFIGLWKAVKHYEMPSKKMKNIKTK